ncbi:MAG: hypothetical protein NTW49_08850 [Bacteroidia bacterium]|nr:hypothetical protein [Bacteroidia bacterium]
MTTEILNIIKSNVFRQWLSNEDELSNFVNGNHRKRELLIRDKLFDELERNFPGRFKKEQNYRDLIDLKTESICELGHSGMFQNPHFVARKCISDYYKRKIRQQDSRNFISLQILTDIKKYQGTIKYQSMVDTLNNNRSWKYGNRKNRICVINQDYTLIGNFHLSQPMNISASIYEIDLYYLISGPLNLNWSRLRNSYNPKEIDLSRIK